MQALTDAFYFNDHPERLIDSLTRLPWSYNLVGHNFSVRSVAFSPDASRIVSASDDKTCSIWDSKTGKRLKTLGIHRGGVWFAAYSKQGDKIGTAGLDSLAILWDANTGEDLVTLRGHRNVLRGIDFSPAGNLVATCSDDSTVMVWSARTGLRKRVLSGHLGKVWTVKFSPDGNLIASGSNDNKIFIWEASTGVRLNVLPGHTGAVRSVAFSKDGSKIISASEDNTIGLWDVLTGKEIIPIAGHFADVWCVDFFTNDSLAVSSSYDNTVRIWNTHSGKQIASLEGHAGSVWAVDVAPNDRMIATGSFDATLKVWDIASINSGEVNMFRSFDLVNQAAFSPDEKKFAIATGPDVEIRNLESGTSVDYLTGHSNVVWAIAYSPDEKYLASASEDGTVMIWNAGTHECIDTLAGHDGPVYNLAFSPDGKKLATVSSDLSTLIWDVPTGDPSIPLRGHTQAIRAVAWSKKGDVIATASDDRDTKIWDASGGFEKITLRGHSYPVRDVTFSPDGSRVATASDDNTAKIWDAITGDLLFTLQGHNASVRRIVYSPDGTRIATASEDKTVKIWNSKTGEIQLTLLGHESNVTTVAFSKNGKQVMSGSDDKTVKIWEVDPDILLKKAEFLHPPTSLVASQIAAFRLSQGLEAVPGGLDSLLQQADDAQILAFARYYEEQASSSDNLLLVKQKYLHAIRLYRKLEQQTGRQEFFKALSKLYTDLGYKFLLSGQPDSALAYLSIADAKDLTVKRYLAHSLLFSGEYRQAANRYLNLLLDDFSVPSIEYDLQGLYDRKLSHADVAKIRRLLSFNEDIPDNLSKAYTSLPSKSKLTETDAITGLDAETNYLYQVLKIVQKQQIVQDTMKKLELLQLAFNLARVWQGSYPASEQAAKAIDHILTLEGFIYFFWANSTIAPLERQKRFKLARGRFELMGTHLNEWKLAGLASVDESIGYLNFYSLNNLPEAISNMEKSVDNFRQLRIEFPENMAYKSIHLPRALVSLSWYQLWNRQYDAAATHAREALRYNPSDLIAHRNLGHALALSGAWDEAIQAYLETGETAENYRLFKRELGQLSPAAVETFIQKLGDKASRWEDEMLANDQEHQARNLFEAKLYLEAVAQKKTQVDVLRRLNGEDPAFQAQLAEALAQLAFYRLFATQASIALPEAEEAYTMCPNCLDVRRHLAHVRLVNGKTKDARRLYFEDALVEGYSKNIMQVEMDFDHMIESNVEAQKTGELRSVLLNDSLLFAEALKLEVPAAELVHFSGVSNALSDSINIASDMGDYRKAASFCPDYIAALTKLHRIEPITHQKSLSDAWGNYSYYALFAKQPKKAVNAARNALALGAGNWVKTNLGHGFLYQGKYQKAKDIYAVIKDVYDPELSNFENLGAAVLDDFRTLKDKGIWHKNVPNAAAFILGKKELSFAEEKVYGK
jgi:WD40 repeat protein